MIENIHEHNNRVGHSLEKVVSEIYSNLGYNNVRTNIILKRKIRKNIIRSEFDVIYGWPITKYIECKYKSKGKKVSAKSTAYFSEKLKLHRIKTYRGTIITNQYLTEKARQICRRNHIKYIEREKLQKLYELSNSIKYFLRKKKKVSIDLIIESM